MFSVADNALKKVLKAAYNANQQDLEPGALENEVQVNVEEYSQSQITSPEPPQQQSSSSPTSSSSQSQITSPEHPQQQSSSSPTSSSSQSQITLPEPGVLGDISQIQCPFRCSIPQIQSSSSPICTTPQRQITSPDPGVSGGLVDNKEPAVLRCSCQKRRPTMNSDFVYEMKKNWNKQDLGVLEETDNSPKPTSSTQEPQSPISSPPVLRRSCRTRRSNRQEDLFYIDKKKHKFSQ